MFILAHILFIAESGKPKTTSTVSNPNTEVILNLYKYDSTNKHYQSSGRSALLHASKTLHINVSDNIVRKSEGVYFDDSALSDLAEFEPFHSDVDIASWRKSPASTSDESPAADEIEPYIVETIERKRFNSNKVQYEVFVKWLGYSCKENTWELPSNIPASILDAYERSLQGGLV